MNDKQLALLLRQIAGRIRALADVVEPLIESGETENRIHYGGDVGRMLKNEPLDDVRPAAVWRILDLAEDIADEAELLSPTADEPVVSNSDDL